MEQAYFISMLYKLDPLVHFMLIISISILLLAIPVYVIGYCIFNNTSTSKYNLRRNIKDIDRYFESMADSCKHIENILDPDSLFKDRPIDNKMFTYIDIQGKTTNLSDDEKHNLKMSIMKLDAQLQSVKPLIEQTESVVKEENKCSSIAVKFIQGLVIFTAILLTLHIFLPSKDFIDKMAENGYTVNTEAK